MTCQVICHAYHNSTTRAVMRVSLNLNGSSPTSKGARCRSNACRRSYLEFIQKYYTQSLIDVWWLRFCYNSVNQTLKMWDLWVGRSIIICNHLEMIYERVAKDINIYVCIRSHHHMHSLAPLWRTNWSFDVCTGQLVSALTAWMHK